MNQTTTQTFHLCIYINNCYVNSWFSSLKIFSKNFFSTSFHITLQIDYSFTQNVNFIYIHKFCAQLITVRKFQNCHSVSIVFYAIKILANNQDSYELNFFFHVEIFSKIVELKSLCYWINYRFFLHLMQDFLKVLFFSYLLLNSKEYVCFAAFLPTWLDITYSPSYLYLIIINFIIKSLQIQ